MQGKLIAKNRKAYFNYEILERFEAGISLMGSEVKSVKNGQINITDSFVRVVDGELMLWNANITRYGYTASKDYDPVRARKLLMHKKQIVMLESKVKQGNYTIVPLAVLLVRGLVKLEIALVRGKKIFEKKLREKEREQKRELDREKRNFMVK